MNLLVIATVELEETHTAKKMFNHLRGEIKV